MTLSLVSVPPFSRSLARDITSSRWSLPLSGDSELYLIPLVIFAKCLARSSFPFCRQAPKGEPPSNAEVCLEGQSLLIRCVFSHTKTVISGLQENVSLHESRYGFRQMCSLCVLTSTSRYILFLVCKCDLQRKGTLQSHCSPCN